MSSDLILHMLPSLRVSGGNGTVEGGNQTQSKTTVWPAKQKLCQKPQRLVPAHPLSKVLRDINNIALSWWDGLTASEREERRRIDERRTILATRMHNARTMKEWETAARELDHLAGNDEWKADTSTGDYQPDTIEARLRDLDEARTNCDIQAMLYLIRTALSRDLGGMGNIDLYRHSYVGTKRLIERYVDSAVKTIEALVEKSAYAMPAGKDHKDLLEGVLYARQSFGRSALLLSGGATFGMAHIGVLKAMFEAKLLPRIISGASAGSIVCSVLCTRTDEEIPTVLNQFPHGDLAVFEEEGREDGLADHIRRLLTEGSWSDIKHLTRVMRGMLGDITFQEAYNRTRRICNICVSSPSIYELPRLLNYVTAPNVMIWSAVAASCSVPLVFNAAPLLVKDPVTGEHIPWNPTPQRYIDGSVDNDLPMTRLAEMFNVNHFIVSQVNPHVVPFLSKDDYLTPTHNSESPRRSQSTGDAPDWLQTLTMLAKDEAIHRLHFLTELGILPNLCTKIRSVLSQRYSGDITILPEISLHDLPRILKNPTADFMLRNCLIGEKAAWPKLSRIRDRCAIELALDRAVHALRARVVFSKSQVDLRRLATGSEQLGVEISGTAANEAAADSAVGRRQTQPALEGVDLAPETLDNGARADHDPYRRRRRGSSSSIQLMVRHRKSLHNLEVVITDDETEEEERLQLSLRRGVQGLYSNGRGGTNHSCNIKSRLMRNSRSHFNLLSHHRGPLTGPLPSNRSAMEGFDFSKPMTPMLSTTDVGTETEQWQVGRNATLDSGRGVCTENDMANVSPRLEMVSPTEGTSDPDPDSSSSEDVRDFEDSKTDDSISDMEHPELSRTGATYSGEGKDQGMSGENITLPEPATQYCNEGPPEVTLEAKADDRPDTAPGQAEDHSLVGS